MKTATKCLNIGTKLSQKSEANFPHGPKQSSKKVFETRGPERTHVGHFNLPWQKTFRLPGKETNFQNWNASTKNSPKGLLLTRVPKILVQTNRSPRPCRVQPEPLSCRLSGHGRSAGKSSSGSKKKKKKAWCAQFAEHDNAKKNFRMRSDCCPNFTWTALCLLQVLTLMRGKHCVCHWIPQALQHLVAVEVFIFWVCHLLTN